MDITPPFGYSEIVPLEKHHRVLLTDPAAGMVPAFARNINAMAISFSEFAVAQRDYPIVFATADCGASFAPVAVLGLADRQNLFIEADARWSPGAYVPAFVRRYPFCISRILLDGVAQDNRLVVYQGADILQLDSYRTGVVRHNAFYKTRGGGCRTRSFTSPVPRRREGGSSLHRFGDSGAANTTGQKGF